MKDFEGVFFVFQNFALYFTDAGKQTNKHTYIHTHTYMHKQHTTHKQNKHKHKHIDLIIKTTFSILLTSSHVEKLVQKFQTEEKDRYTFRQPHLNNE